MLTKDKTWSQKSVELAKKRLKLEEDTEIKPRRVKKSNISENFSRIAIQSQNNSISLTANNSVKNIFQKQKIKKK